MTNVKKKKDLRFHLSLVNIIYNSCEATAKKVHYLRDDSVIVRDIVMLHWSLSMGPIGYPETSVNNYQSGGAVGWGTALQAGRPRVRFPMV
jgi:hypothetical protein